MLKNTTGKIYFTIFVGLLALSAYFSIHTYIIHIETAEKNVLAKLQSISKTLSAQMDGHKLKMVLEMFPEKDGITQNDQHPYYLSQHKILKKTKQLNNIQTSIYTLSYDSAKHDFFYGISSSDKPFFRHRYQTFPEELLVNYKEGGTIPAYTDKHGVWLTAFTPIFDEEEIIGIVLVDMKFDEFIYNARKDLLQSIAISLLIFVTVSIILYRLLSKILKEDEKRKRIIRQKNEELNQKNKDITASLLYAKGIQDAMLPTENRLKTHLKESFVLYKPRDIVSGDFYWMNTRGEEIYVACADCTGHGVPGAIVSVICSNVLNRAMNQLQLSEPCVILDKASQLVEKVFEKSEKEIKDGMDICFCKINLSNRKLTFSGAYNPLYLFTEIDDDDTASLDGVIHNGRIKLIEFSSDKQSVGKSLHKEPFTQKEISLKPNDTVYIFTDGYADQFGGAKGKKFLSKRFKELLLSIQDKTMEEQKSLINKAFEDWKGEEEQVDDVCVMGFRF